MKYLIIIISLVGQLPLLIFASVVLVLRGYLTLAGKGMARNDDSTFSWFSMSAGNFHIALSDKLWPSIMVVLCFAGFLLASVKLLKYNN